ncbi:hypothetical protein [Fluviispira vulneris]|nr:hypothetical protein [Fluviispira vulneris]
MPKFIKILILLYLFFWTQYSFAIYYASDRYTNSGDPEFIGLAGTS